MKNWYIDKRGNPRQVSREYPLPWREYSTAEKVDAIASGAAFIILVILLSFL
jgi:hypothetical protein